LVIALSFHKEQREQERAYQEYERREVHRGLEQLDRGEISEFTAETVIA
jgi:hypothetical protein